MVLKDQQEPHYCWFLIGVTAPLVTQSTEAGKDVSGNTTSYLSCLPLKINYPFCKAANSWLVRSEN